MKLDELMNCSIDELTMKFEQHMESNRYRHDVAVLFGTLGISPSKYNSFMKTLDDIELLTGK